MQARSALFDLYGDYLRPRGGRAPVAALVRLLAPLGIAAPAVRTAVSRMVRQGWLHPQRLATGPGYQLTPKAVRRLDEAAARIYRTDRSHWDGRFDLVVFDPPAQRTERAKLAANLSFLGYGAIDTGTWVATRPTDEVTTLLDEAGIRAERFTARHAGGTPGAIALVDRAWDLAEIGAAYETFVKELTPVVAGIAAGRAGPEAGPEAGPGAGQEAVQESDERAYAARFALVHAWRTFLFRDPQLPPALLPEGWPGTAAGRFFDHHAARLRPAADRYVEHCLETAAARVPAPVP